MFDISEKIDDFIESEAPMKAIVMGYYMNFIPYFVNLFSPLFTFIAVIYFTSKMASNSEIIAILSGGMSFTRMLVPYVIGAIVITVLSLWLNNFVIPEANQGRLEFEETYIRSRFYNSDRNIHRQLDSTTFIYFERFDNLRNIGHKFSVEKIVDGQLQYKLLSQLIRWDSTSNKWSIEDYYIREIDGLEEKLTRGTKMDTVLGIHPSEFARRINTIETMDYFELNEFIETEKLKGSEKVIFYEIEKHKRFSLPFATIVMTLIGVSLASRKVKGGIGFHLGMGLLISFSYILFMQVSLTFATNANLPAFTAMWIPNVLFAGLALYLLKLAPK
ncbi:MAG: permease [Bacteroidetes bacterium]|nr:MAG: permease [Bacteroidota bacterium]